MTKRLKIYSDPVSRSISIMCEAEKEKDINEIAVVDIQELRDVASRDIDIEFWGNGNAIETKGGNLLFLDSEYLLYNVSAKLFAIKLPVRSWMSEMVDLYNSPRSEIGILQSIGNQPSISDIRLIKRNLLINTTNTYIMYFPSLRLYKIGRSKNPEKRRDQLAREYSDYSIDILWHISAPIQHELWIHRRFETRMSMNEFFILSKNQANDMVDNLLFMPGYMEWAKGQYSEIYKRKMPSFLQRKRDYLERRFLHLAKCALSPKPDSREFIFHDSWLAE